MPRFCLNFALILGYFGIGGPEFGGGQNERAWDGQERGMRGS
jgi:hypothetical protein